MLSTSPYFGNRLPKVWTQDLGLRSPLGTGRGWNGGL